MIVRLKFFARLRERLGPGEEITLPSGATVADARALLRARGGVWEDALPPGQSVRCAVDQVMAGEGTALREGAELAFFPPVTGG